MINIIPVDLRLSDNLSLRAVIVYQNKKYVYIVDRKTWESYIVETDNELNFKTIESDEIFDTILNELVKRKIILTDYEVKL